MLDNVILKSKIITSSSQWECISFKPGQEEIEKAKAT